MKILVLYFRLDSYKDRNTIYEHLYSFRRYVNGVEFQYINTANGVPWYLAFPKYNGVILHYTFLAARWSQHFYESWKNTTKRLKKIDGYKVAIPQDD